MSNCFWSLIITVRVTICRLVLACFIKGKEIVVYSIDVKLFCVHLSFIWFTWFWWGRENGRERFCGICGLLTYRKPTHTDQYLAYDSHHLQSMKRVIVKCLYDRARHFTTKPLVISEEKKHLSSVLVSNDYPSSFVRKLVKTRMVTANKEPA